MKAWRFVVLPVVCMLFSGCGEDGPERTIVSGTVTFNGHPIEMGLIRFVPARQTAAPVSGAEIRNGCYSVTKWGGVPVGTHRIEVIAHRARHQKGGAEPPSPVLNASGGQPMEQYIPEKYNIETTLEITIPSGSGKIVKDFDLTD